MIANVKLVLKLAVAVLMLLLLLPFHLLALAVAKRGHTRFAGILPVVFHKILLFLFDIRIDLDGKLPKERPLLLVSNHVSWLDIVILGAVTPLSFAAKSEMKSWPVFGSLAKLQRTVFLDRNRRSTAGRQASDIAQRMTAHEIIVLFPEGTTTDGNQLAPFKTPLFEAAKIALKESPVETALVQPISIAYSHFHGLPIGRAERPHISWPGEIGLGESLIPLFREGALDVSVRIGTPIMLTEQSNRKIIAKDTAASIRSMLDSSYRAS